MDEERLLAGVGLPCRAQNDAIANAAVYRLNGAGRVDPGLIDLGWMWDGRTLPGTQVG